jgi:hypothetical protein
VQAISIYNIETDAEMIIHASSQIDLNFLTDKQDLKNLLPHPRTAHIRNIAAG